MKVWILTYEINEHDQHGEYFAGVWQNKPSIEDIKDIILAQGYDSHIDPDYEVNAWAEHILNGGGRRFFEYMWFWLRETECK